MTKKKALYHTLALITVIVWGLTFVSTKVLIKDGLNPIEIFIIRFTIAYLCALILSHRNLWADCFRDEIILLAAGISGGSLYFIAENTALSLTFVSNVSLIICCAPIFTAILGKFIFLDKIKKYLWVGSSLAFLGVIIIVMSGADQYSVNFKGDLLTGLAALSWAVYCLILRTINTKYSNTFITRKVFAYGVLSALVYYTAAVEKHATILTEITSIIWNLAFLSIGASFICYLMWNAAVKNLGAEKTSNYIYLVPLVTIIASKIILNEPFSLVMAFSSLLIIGGVALATK